MTLRTIQNQTGQMGQTASANLNLAGGEVQRSQTNSAMEVDTFGLRSETNTANQAQVEQRQESRAEVL